MREIMISERSALSLTVVQYDFGIENSLQSKLSSQNIFYNPTVISFEILNAFLKNMLKNVWEHNVTYGTLL